MVFNRSERNRVLCSLRDRPEVADSPGLMRALGLPRELVERYLVYCVDYGLAVWTGRAGGSRRAAITWWGRGFLAAQGL